MFRIRLHGRGGQGVKTAGRILGTAFFLEGFHVQDAPRYGAERRGAPIFSFVRADRREIHERGVIVLPDLVAVTDQTLLDMPGAGVWEGVGAETPVLVATAHSRERLLARFGETRNIIVCDLPANGSANAPTPLLGMAALTLAGAAARLTGVITAGALRDAIAHELVHLGPEALARSLEQALAAFAGLESRRGELREGALPDARHWTPPRWIRLEHEPSALAAPAIRNTANSSQVTSDQWRTERPVLDAGLCKGCWWVCATFCPDNAVLVNGEGRPVIDYSHCKGCLICVEQCPSGAMTAAPEPEAQTAGEGQP